MRNSDPSQHPPVIPPQPRFDENVGEKEIQDAFDAFDNWLREFTLLDVNAGKMANARIKPPDRVVFDEESLMVTIDDAQTVLEPVAYQFVFAIARPGRLGSWVPGPEIQQRRGLTGKKLKRDVLRKIPESIRRLISSAPGAGGGYCMILPPPPKSCP